MEFTRNWVGKLVDTCSTKNSGVFHEDFFMWIIGVDLHVEPYFYSTCNPRCISHVDYLCTFSGVGPIQHELYHVD